LLAVPLAAAANAVGVPLADLLAPVMGRGGAGARRVFLLMFTDMISYNYALALDSKQRPWPIFRRLYMLWFYTFGINKKYITISIYYEIG
jgi:hypothetical protein